MITWTAFVSWIRGVPTWLWMGAAAFLGLYLIRRDAYHDGKREGEDNITDQIERQADERLERARKARADVEHGSSDDLNAGQLERLRKRRAADPYNRGGL
ncbi:MAG: hypothetical protein AAFR33_10170 [Pseudomonadota bacterium]